MNYLQAVILALVQGATEFIPISSSGHLVLVREWLGWSDEGGMAFDTVLHGASLLAILVYFRDEWRAVFRSLSRRPGSDDPYHRHLPFLLIVATLPVVIAGPFTAAKVQLLRKGGTVGLIMIMTAVWLLACESRKKGQRSSTGYLGALLIGIAQVFALLPGASRAGLTTGAGVLCGLTREKAARFSFLMAIPAIIGAVVYETVHKGREFEATTGWGVLLAAFVVCFVVSLGAIHFCLKFFRSHSLIVFGLYLAALGIVLVILQYGV